MTDYIYKAKGSDGKIINGCLSASDISELSERLKNRGCILLEVKERVSESDNFSASANSFGRAKEFSIKEKKEFITNLLFFYNSGMPMTEALSAISTSANFERVRILGSNLLKSVEKGKSFKEAVAKYSKTIGEAYSSIIGAGDESGELDTVLDELLKNIENEENTANEIKKAIAYPLFVMFICINVFMLMKFFVIKMFDAAIAGEGIAPCAIKTVLLLTAGKMFLFWLIFAVVFFVCAKSEAFKKTMRALFLKIPFIKGIAADSDFINFFSVFHIAYKAGLPGVQSVSAAISVVKDVKTRQSLYPALLQLEKGSTVTTALATSGCFPKELLSPISAGEMAGKLDEAAKRVAKNLGRTLKTKVKIILKLLEPVTMILVGFMVLYVAVSLYKAYFNSMMSILQ